MRRKELKRKGLKRAAGVLLILTMAGSVVGCGKDKAVNSNAIDKEHVFSYEEVELPVRLDDARSIFYENGRVYVVGTSYEAGTKLYLCSMNQDGTDAQSVELKTGYEMPQNDAAVSPDNAIAEDDAAEDSATEDDEAATDRPTPRTLEEPEPAVKDLAVDAEAVVAEEEPVMEEPAVDPNYTGSVDIWPNAATVDKNGNIIGTVEVYLNYQDEIGEYQSDSKMLLIKWNPAGEILWSKDLNEGRPEGESFYVSNMFCDEENTLWMFGQNTICTYDADGNQTNQKRLEEEFGTMYAGKKGDIYLNGWNSDYTKRFMKKLDKKTLAIGKEIEMPEFVFNYSMLPGGDLYDFLLLDSAAVYGYNIGEEEPVELMDMIDSDMNTYGFNQVALIDREHFAAIYNDGVDWTLKLSLFTKVAPEDVKEKTPIQMACMWMPGNVRTRIVDFNKTNPTYRIQVEEYQKYSTMDDYMGGYTKLNNDIVAGKMPDILLVDSSMPIDSYVSKGLLADMNPLLDADPELNRDDYLENIFEAFSVDGKMYRLVTSFNVSTVIGKTALVGDRDGWNMQEFEELMASLPKETKSFSYMTRESMIYTGIMMTKNEYMDKETGKCSFDSEGFVDFLKFVAQFPANEENQGIADDVVGMDYWASEQTAYREDRTILMNRYISNYQDFNRVEKGDFGEDVNIIGFPTAGRNGNAILPNLSFSIFAKSPNMDGAWEFIRYYLTDEYQKELTYEFPVKKSALAEREQEAMERPYWEDENGNKEYYDDVFWLNDVEVKIEPMTQEEAQEFTEFLKSLTLVGEYDQKLVDIITEEAAPFFEGQKTAEDVAKIIQSRVQLYVSESR